MNQLTTVINKLLGENTMQEQWPDRDSIEISSVYGDETCNECGAACDSEYCHLCAPHME